MPCKTKGKYNEMDENTRKAVLSMLLGISKCKDVRTKDLRWVANSFGSSVSAVARLWRKAKTSRATGVLVQEEVMSKRTNCKGKRLYDPADIQNALKEIPFSQRKTLRKAANCVGVSHMTLHRMKIKGEVIRRTSSLKPALTEDNMSWRVAHALSMGDGTKTHYEDLYDMVHVDEKWLDLTKDGVAYLMAPDEELPYRSCQSKRFITKVMFLCAMAPPRNGSQGCQQASKRPNKVNTYLIFL